MLKNNIIIRWHVSCRSESSESSNYRLKKFTVTKDYIRNSPWAPIVYNVSLESLNCIFSLFKRFFLAIGGRGGSADHIQSLPWAPIVYNVSLESLYCISSLFESFFLAIGGRGGGSIASYSCCASEIA